MNPRIRQQLPNLIGAGGLASAGGLPLVLDAIPDGWGPVAGLTVVGLWVVWTAMEKLGANVAEHLDEVRAEIARGISRDERLEQRLDDLEEWLRQLRARAHGLASHLRQRDHLEQVLGLDDHLRTMQESWAREDWPRVYLRFVRAQGRGPVLEEIIAELHSIAPELSRAWLAILEREEQPPSMREFLAGLQDEAARG